MAPDMSLLPAPEAATQAIPSPIIVHVVQRMTVGGIETFVLDLLRRDRTSHVINLDGEIDDLVDYWPPLHEIRDRIWTIAKPAGISPAAVKRLVALFHRLHPNLVVAHHSGPLIYGGLAARLAGVPLIYFEHDVWHYDRAKDRIFGKVLSSVLTPRYVAISALAAQRVREVVGNVAVEVIPPGVDTDRFVPDDRTEARRRLGLPLQSRLVGSMGRLVPGKGVDHLIDALAMLDGDVELVVIGDGPARSALEAQAAALGLAQRTHFLGNCDRVERILPALDIFCLPSLAEGLPRSLLEAQACGIAVVATDVGSSREAVCPQTGVVVPPSSPSSIAEALRERLGAIPQPAVTRQFVLKFFSIAAVQEKLARLSRLEPRRLNATGTSPSGQPL